jgi:hypothetical protein
MILLLACTTAIASDSWDIKPLLTSTTKLAWEIAVDATLQGETHSATFDLIEAGREGDAAKGQPVHLEMTNIVVESNSMPGSGTDAIVDAQNVVQSTTEDDINRRMFSPLLFIYPKGPVSVGDTWKTDFTPASKGVPKIKFEFTAKQTDQVNGSDALQVTSTVKEEGDEGVSADGTWWVDRTGKVLKFKITAKKWVVVPTGGQTMDATFTGKFKA